jgi:hypothetical protein
MEESVQRIKMRKKLFPLKVTRPFYLYPWKYLLLVRISITNYTVSLILQKQEELCLI